MSPIQTAILGICWWCLSLYQVIIMAWLWKYNNPQQQTSESEEMNIDPWQSSLRKWVISHRVIGLIYTFVYIFLVTQMVPHLWNHQVELPPQMVLHVFLGISIGIILIIKISIVRFFQHLGNILPIFGFSLFFFTTILLVFIVPTVYQESKLITTTQAYSNETLNHLEHLLPQAGYSEEEINQLANAEVITSGRRVMLQKCVQCHGLRTIFKKPRAPKEWSDLIVTMATKPMYRFHIFDQEIDQVTAYLVGITPLLE